MMHFQEIEGHRLNASPHEMLIRKLGRYDGSLCALHCVSVISCVAFNLQAVEPFDCELVMYTADTSEANLVVSATWNYYYYITQVLPVP